MKFRYILIFILILITNTTLIAQSSTVVRSNNFKNGGYVIYEKNGHGLVVALKEYEFVNWHKAKDICEKYIFEEYIDWRMPTLKELELIYEKLGKHGIYRFDDKIYDGIDVFHDWYWSSDEDGEFGAKAIVYTKGGTQWRMGNKNENGLSVRPVRSF